MNEQLNEIVHGFLFLLPYDQLLYNSVLWFNEEGEKLVTRPSGEGLVGYRTGGLCSF